MESAKYNFHHIVHERICENEETLLKTVSSLNAGYRIAGPLRKMLSEYFADARARTGYSGPVDAQELLQFKPAEFVTNLREPRRVYSNEVARRPLSHLPQERQQYPSWSYIILSTLLIKGIDKNQRDVVDLLTRLNLDLRYRGGSITWRHEDITRLLAVRGALRNTRFSYTTVLRMCWSVKDYAPLFEGGVSLWSFARVDNYADSTHYTRVYDIMPLRMWPRIVLYIKKSEIIHYDIGPSFIILWILIHIRMRRRLRNFVSTRITPRFEHPPVCPETPRPLTRNKLIAWLSTAGRGFAHDYWINVIPMFNTPDTVRALGPLPARFTLHIGGKSIKN